MQPFCLIVALYALVVRIGPLFLQGLVTNDVHKITQDQAIYTALLSPQGKFHYDLFIIGEGDAWLIDCEKDRADALLKRLSLYKLRSDITLENISDTYSVIALWGGTDPLSLPDGVTFADPRLPELGHRGIIPVEKISQACDQASLTVTSFEGYDAHRLKLGIPDGSRDIIPDRGIILECGLDELNAIDWDKGCYMGQELTARTRYRGLVRKRLFPVRIEGETPAFQAPIFQGEKEVGEMRTAAQEWGLAMIRLEALEDKETLRCGKSVLTPHVLGWMKLPASPQEG